MESSSIKDITFVVYTVISEFMSEYFEFFKVTEEITIGLRVLIGTLIHMIELVIVFFAGNKLNTSKTFTPINGVSKHGLIITVFVLVILFVIASIAYLTSAILNRKKESFDLLINKRKHRLLASFLKISSILFLLFKALSIVVSTILVVNSTEIGAEDKINSFFAAYSAIDLVISVCGLTSEFLRFIFLDLLCYNKLYRNKLGVKYIQNKINKTSKEFILFDASRAIKWYPLWHEFEKRKHEFDELYYETYANFCLSTCVCFFMCCSIPGKIYAKRALIAKQNIENDINSNENLKNFKKYKKKAKILNMVLKTSNILLIITAATVTGYFMGVSFYKPENECPAEYFESGDGFELNSIGYSIRYVEINSIKKEIKCEKQWLRIMYKDDYPLYEYQRYYYDFSPINREYINGFDNSRNYWKGLNDINYLTNKQNRKLIIAFGNETFTDYIEFSLFKVSSAMENYKLELGSMTKNTLTNVPDWSYYHNGMNFQANRSTKCSGKWISGWWFNDCFGICPTCFNGTLYDSNNRLYYLKRIKMLMK